MELYIVSASTNPAITRPLLDSIADALQFQIFQHAAGFCQIAGVKVSAISSISSLPTVAGASPLVVYDTPDQADDLGWHTYNAAEGQIHGTAFLDPILSSGGTLLSGANSLSAVLSHEALEAVNNPYVNLYSMLPDGKTMEPFEAADRCEGDSYDLGGVSVTNFLSPRAFRDGPGPFDWLRKQTAAWEISPAGYCQRVNVTTGEVSTLWGAKVTPARKALVAIKHEKNLSRLSHYAHHAKKAA